MAGREFPAFAAFQHGLRGRLPRFVDNRPVGIAQIRPDVFFTPYFPAVFCRRHRRRPDRDRNGNRGRRARRRRQLQ